MKGFFESGRASSSEQESQADKLLRLRAEIRRAEELEDEGRVLMLEAELKAAEIGASFDREKYLERIRQGGERDVLRKLQGMNVDGKDKWNWDGAYEEHDYRSYDIYFKSLLQKAGYESFQDLVQKRSHELGRAISALDLFGGGYFLPDLKNVQKMVGARLIDRDADFKDHRARPLIADKRRKVIEGNLYEGKTWKLVAKELGETDGGFDLITCRPQGPFGHTSWPTVDTPIRVQAPEDSRQKEQVYITLLNRALALLSPEGGILFAQEPVLGTPPRDVREFWNRYVQEKGKEGFEFFFDNEDTALSEKLVVRRSTMNVSSV